MEDKNLGAHQVEHKEECYITVANRTESPSTLEEVSNVLNQFRKFSDNWDNKNSKAPLPNVIDESLEFLKYWSNKSIIPKPELTERGSVALRVFDKFGGIKGEIRFVGDCKAAFIVLKNKVLVSSFPFKTKDSAEMSKAEKYFSEYMVAIDNK